jgi:hypothetical protein
VICEYRRKLAVEFHFEFNLMFPQIDGDQVHYRPDQLVDVDLGFVVVSLLNIDLTVVMISLAR